MSSEITYNENVIDNKPAGSKIVARSLLLCIFILIARHTLLTRGRAINELAVVDTYAAIDLAVVSMAALILILSGNFVRTWVNFSRSPVIWLGGYYIFCGISFLWSEIPAFTFYRSIEYLILLTATLTVVAQYQDFDTTEQAFCRITVATLIFDILIIVRMYGVSFSLMHWHTATYSISSVILFCYCLGEYLAMSQGERSDAKERSRRLLRYGIFSLFTLALGTSSASNVSAAVGCMLIFLALRRFGWLIIGIWISFLLFLFGSRGETIRHLLFPGKADKEIATATGRTFLWEYLWQKFLQSPILGHGFGLVGIISDGMATHAHNSFFPVLIGTGLVGIFFFGFFVVQLWLLTIRKMWRGGQGVVGFAGALAAAFVNGLAVPVMADRWQTFSIVFVFLLGFFLLQIQQSGNSTKDSEEPFSSFHISS